MSSDNPRSLHETHSERLERAGGPPKPMIIPVGWNGLIAAALIAVILVILGLGFIIFSSAGSIFQSRNTEIQRMERDLK